ncbi:MAG: translation initiation factor [Chitinophagales bacterium]|jgi:translation initiation factor 1|nr:translation initiation factor [Chitinophagales bacterium]
MENKNTGNKIVFSTNKSLDLGGEKEEVDTIAPHLQTLYVSLERNKGGKVATIVENFQGSQADLESLGKMLKNKCGVGGTVKDGIILIQGEKRDRVVDLLVAMSYKVKKKGG